MLSALSRLEEWDRLSSEEKREVAKDVEQRLPLFRKILSQEEQEFLKESTEEEDEEKEELRKEYPIVFQDLRVFRVGDQEHEIAAFSFLQTTTLLLVPGGRNVSLGYDAGMYDDFPSQEDIDTYSNQQYGMDWPPLSEMIEQVVSSKRSVTLDPFLIDASPNISDLDGYEALEKAVEDSGWALPSDDEWEWAYRGGTALFYPCGNKFGKIEHSAFGFEPPESTYNTEVTNSGRVSKGGDGGACECGGYTGIVWELIHACSYTTPQELSDYHDDLYYRRVYRLSTLPD